MQSRAKRLVRARLWIAQCGCCFYCGQKIYGKATIDHVIPKHRGGQDESWNMALAHERCNQNKADRMPTDEEMDRRAAMEELIHHVSEVELTAVMWWKRRQERRANRRG